MRWCLWLAVFVSACSQQFSDDPQWHLSEEHFKRANDLGVEADQWSALYGVRSEEEFNFVLRTEAKKPIAQEHLAYREVLKEWVIEREANQVAEWKAKKERLEVEIEVAKRLGHPISALDVNNLAQVNEQLGSKSRCETLRKGLAEEKLREDQAYREVYKERGIDPPPNAGQHSNEPDWLSLARVMVQDPCLVWEELAKPPGVISPLDQIMLKKRVADYLSRAGSA